jgi:hypothetical protein
MTPDDEPDLLRIGSELRARRLGFALRSLAAELVEERGKVAQLRREIADLRAQLESLEPTQAEAAAPDRAGLGSASVTSSRALITAATATLPVSPATSVAPPA